MDILIMRFTLFQGVRLALILSIILMGCAENPETPPEDKQTTASGIIETDTSWSIEHSPYIVTGDIVVKRNATLTIQPGVEVRFDGFYGLTVQGTLIADGTAGVQQLKENPENIAIGQSIEVKILDFPPKTYEHTNLPASQQLSPVSLYSDIILFTSNKSFPEIKDWKGILFDNTNDNKSLLRFVKIQYADIGVDCFSSMPRITDCIVKNNQYGITWSFPPPTVNHNIISDNIYGLAISDYIVLNKNIITSNEVGIIAATPCMLLENNIFGNIGYALIYTSQGSFVDARYNWWGTIAIDSISRQIYDGDDDAKLGKVLYQPILTSELKDAGPHVNTMDY
jgi:hypothetical protein